MRVFRSYLTPVVCIVVGILFIGAALVLILRSHVLTSNSVEIIEENEKSTLTEQSDKNTQIIVEVAGAVEKPGVYSLPQGSRIQDALYLAGSILSTADIVGIERTINKAAKLVDGQKIYIPQKGEEPTTSTLGVMSSQALINVNVASQSDLESLPGIGPVSATKIITGRPYGSANELVSKKVISSSAFEKIKDLITLY